LSVSSGRFYEITKLKSQFKTVQLFCLFLGKFRFELFINLNRTILLFVRKKLKELGLLSFNWPLNPFDRQG